MDDRKREFEEVFAAFQPKILRYLIHLVGESEAEDLTQDVFFKPSRALENFRSDSQLCTQDQVTLGEGKVKEEV